MLKTEARFLAGIGKLSGMEAWLAYDSSLQDHRLSLTVIDCDLCPPSLLRIGMSTGVPDVSECRLSLDEVGVVVRRGDRPARQGHVPRSLTIIVNLIERGVPDRSAGE